MLSHDRRNERGNAFFFVILGIVLFAALIFTVSRGMSENPGKISERQGKIYASELMGIAQQYGRGVQKLLQRGCSENEISFENPEIATYVNGDAPSDKSCHMFDPAGAGLSWKTVNSGAVDAGIAAEEPSYDGHVGEIAVIKSDAVENLGSASPELVLSFPFLKKEICEMINRSLGIPGDLPEDDLDGWAAGGHFQGTFATGGAVKTIGDTVASAALEEKPAFCVTSTDATPYNAFIYVLIER